MKNKKYTPQKLVPYGLLATREWLNAKGVPLHTLDNWIKSGRLTSIAHGVYIRPDTTLTWEGVVCSLQHMRIQLCPGGITAIKLQGLSHYTELGTQTTIHLYGQDQLPSWINSLIKNVTFTHHSEKKLMGGSTHINHSYNVENNWLTNNDPLVKGNGLRTQLALGSNDWPITVSTPECAWFEILIDVPERISFEYADQLMQGLVNLSPKRLNKLLELSHNVKARRLFLWFAERYQHAWLKKIDTERFTMDSGLLGSGKRMLAKGGKLDPKYLITVPTEMYESKINE